MNTRQWTLAEKLRALADQEEGDALDDLERARLKALVDDLFLQNRIEIQVLDIQEQLGLIKRFQH